MSLVCRREAQPAPAKWERIFGLWLCEWLKEEDVLNVTPPQLEREWFFRLFRNQSKIVYDI